MYMRFIHDFATAQNDNNIIFDHWTRPGWHGCLQRHACARTWVGHGVLFVGLAIHVCLHTPCVPLSLLRSWARCSDYTEHLVWPTQTHSHIHANMCGIWWTHWNIPFFFMANNFWFIIFGAKYRRDPWYVKCDADVEAYFHRLHLQTDTNTSLDVCMWCKGILHISVLSDLTSIGHCEDAEMRKKNQTKRTGLRTNIAHIARNDFDVVSVGNGLIAYPMSVSYSTRAACSISLSISVYLCLYLLVSFLSPHSVDPSASCRWRGFPVHLNLHASNDGVVNGYSGLNGQRHNLACSFVRIFRNSS